MEQTANFNAPSPFVLALDVGTSSTRAMLFDATGATVPGIEVQEKYELTTSREGEVSVDADKLVAVVASSIDKAIQAAGSRASSIAAVATDTFWHSLVGVDAAGHPLTPVITWEDTRPHQAAAELSKQLDSQAIHQRTGARLHASYWPAKIRWLATTQPEVFKQVAHWLSFGEYLHRQLLGHAVCSLSMASGTGMLGIRTRQWDRELIEALGVRGEQFSALGDIHDKINGLTPAYASRWPALRDVPWFPAIGDGAAANVGSGCVSEDKFALTIGTSSAIRVIVAPEQVVPPPGLWLYLVDAKRALLGGALSEGGNIFAWLGKTVQITSLKEVDAEVAKLPPDGHGLTILPFISGERSLGWHAEARAVIAGINAHISPVEMVRAAQEALAYQLEAVYQQLKTALELHEKPPILVASGGALLSSPSLQQIVADTLASPLYPTYEQEASARGAALLALEAIGAVPDVAHLAPELAEPVQPDAQRSTIYQQGAQRQRQLYQTLLGPI